ncbi:MAG: cellulase family glycosylhydrolase [Bacteroidaceae bacterium]|nr:cellulase family glycosylhydrolase [Candidatus Minthousia equi]MCQ2246038.1 cellulase family glycosylhydrolase [Bacteroidaceae bacterium]
MKKHLFLGIFALLLLGACSKDDWKPVDPEPTPVPTPTPTPSPDPTPTPGDVVAQHNALPLLHVDGRFLKNDAGEVKNLHGFWQTYSPWFNGDAWGVHNWGDYNVDACLKYNQQEIDKILSVGWKVDFMRLHMDSYWSLSRTRPWPTNREEYEDFDEELFKEYLNKVFVPMIEYCINKGLYVVLMPGYSCPEKIKKGDQFYQVLTKLWNNISKHPKIQNNMDVMFEIVNEPRSIVDANGVAGGNDDSHNKALTEYMQSFYDLIRNNGAKNIIWIPGTGYQSQYAGYAKYKINGENFGFAVHCYPGWYGSDAEKESAELGGSMGGGFEAFRSGWEAQIKPAAEIAPIMVTEMDWAPAVYNKSWGKSFTGEAGGSGFGANFKWLADNTGNVSYILFTAPNDLAMYNGVAGSAGNYSYWNDPKGCPWQIYHWYQEYRNGNIEPTSANEIRIGGASEGFTLTTNGERTIVLNACLADGVIFPLQTAPTLVSSNPSVVKVSGNKVVGLKEGKATVTAYALGLETSCEVTVGSLFPLTKSAFNPNIWEKGTFDEATRTFTTGQYGFAGWEYSGGVDISSHKYIVVKLGNGTDYSCQPSFRLFDKGYWDGAAEYDFNNNSELKIEIAKIKRKDGNSFDTKHVTIIGFWTLGGKKVVIDKIGFED